MNLFVSILIAVLMFGVLIFIHELGHFLAARKAGILVEEFSLGMGPRILKKQGKETLYSLRAFPIGGSCRMHGEDSGVSDERSFNSKTKLQRIGVLLAGAVMNLLFGMLLILIINVCVAGFVSTTVDSVYLDEQTEFRAEDKIISLDGYRTMNYTDMSFAITNIDSETFDAVVLRDGERVKLTDVPYIETEEGFKIGVAFKYEEKTLGNVLKNTLTESLSIVRLVWMSLVYLVTGKVGLNQLSGPVGITVMIEQTVQYGILTVLNFVAMIAINLGVVNLLPLPALDGGRIFFVVVEAIIGRRIPPEKEGIVHLIGFALLMALTVFVFVSDIIKVVK